MRRATFDVRRVITCPLRLRLGLCYVLPVGRVGVFFRRGGRRVEGGGWRVSWRVESREWGSLQYSAPRDGRLGAEPWPFTSWTFFAEHRCGRSTVYNLVLAPVERPTRISSTKVIVPEAVDVGRR